PIDRWKSTRDRWPTSRSTLRVVFWNPASSTSTTYEPGIRLGMTNVPWASVIDTVGTFVATFRAVTVAPGTTASDVSLTVPVIVARSTCAKAVDASSRHATTATTPCRVPFMTILQNRVHDSYVAC